MHESAAPAGDGAFSSSVRPHGRVAHEALDAGAAVPPSRPNLRQRAAYHDWDMPPSKLHSCPFMLIVRHPEMCGYLFPSSLSRMSLDPENRGIYNQSDSSKKSSRNIWSLAVVSVDQRYCATLFLTSTLSTQSNQSSNCLSVIDRIQAVSFSYCFRTVFPSDSSLARRSAS